MLSQHLTIDILNHAGGDLYARTGEGESRAVLFGITSGGDRDWNTVYVNINNPVVTARIVKPDGTFTITTAELISGPGELQEFRFYIPEAATQVSGIGSYDIRIQEDGEENIVYSAQGRFLCDDNMLTDEMIESVAEVNGLIFPDDFLTKDSGAATIDDTETALDSTWSSQKISNMISAAAGELEDDIADLIDDETTSATNTWSSDKIAEEIAANSPTHIYSTTPQKVGEWIHGEDIMEVVVDLGAAGLSVPAGQWVSYNNRIVPANARIISGQGISVESNWGWTFSPMNVYQPVADNSYCSFYGPSPNGLWMRYIIVQYYIPA